MSVVSDTTAITTLLKAKEESLLQVLFERILVPQAVWDELKEFHAEIPKFIELHPATKADRRLPGTDLLGRGEAEALLLAKQLNARLLLADDPQSTACRAATADSVHRTGWHGGSRQTAW